MLICYLDLNLSQKKTNKPHTGDNNIEHDISNNAFEISTINSNKFNSKQFANCNVEVPV